MCKFFGYRHPIGDNSFFILNKLKLRLIIIVFINFLKHEMITHEFSFVILGVYCDMKRLQILIYKLRKIYKIESVLKKEGLHRIYKVRKYGFVQFSYPITLKM